MNVLGYDDLSQRWGVNPSTLYQWKFRGKLPPPDVSWSKSPGWYESTIEAVERELGLRRTDNGSTGTSSG